MDGEDIKQREVIQMGICGKRSHFDLWPAFLFPFESDKVIVAQPATLQKPFLRPGTHHILCVITQNIFVLMYVHTHLSGQAFDHFPLLAVMMKCKAIQYDLRTN